MKKLFLVWIIVISVFSDSISQVISISEARSKSTGTSVTVRGIILNGGELGVIRYLQDTTGGIGLYDSDLKGLKRGDSVEVTGEISPYNNLMEIGSVTNFKVLSSGNQLPAPKDITFSKGFSENYECQLVKFRGIKFSTSGTFSGGTNYDILQSGNTRECRIESNTNIPGTKIPADEITLIGIMSQYKTTYQILPRDLGDLGFINSQITISEIEKTSFTLSFQTEEKGQTIFKYGLSQSLEMGEVKNTNLTTSHSETITGLFPAKFFYVQALTVNATSDTMKSGLYYFTTASESNGDIKVYFNHPVDKSYSKGTDAIWLNQKIDDTLVAYINRTKKTIDMAIYNLNNNGMSANISTALNNAANRGVRVRVIYEGENANLGINELNSNIRTYESPQGSNYKIMHNKFLVFDADGQPNDAIVWTGSTNLTEGQVHEDPNDVIIITDQALARAYVKEFEEMWGSSSIQPNAMKSKFGPFKSDNTPHFFNIGGKLVECYFSPSDNVNSKIKDAVETADIDIYFATMVFTRTSIAYPMLDRHDEGVYIAGIFDNVSGTSGAAYDVLKPVLDTNIIVYSSSEIMHHKYAIIDQSVHYSDPILITGSHNWSSSADNSNDENILFIHDQEIANIYFQEWAKLFAEEGGTVYVGQEENMIENKQEIRATIINDQIRVFMPAEHQGNTVLNLYNLKGSLIYSDNITVSKGNNILEMNVPGLKEQIYLLNIQSENTFKTIKLLKY
jgi:phosphatidylserine/phosphatidylglycerophosphate/cardiolipin synthase-like enzyme